MANHVETTALRHSCRGKRLRAIPYYRYLFQNSFQCFTDIRQAANGFHACGFQSSEFLIRSPFPTGNDDPRGPYVCLSAQSHQRCNPQCGNVLFDVRSCFFFSATADLTDHHYCFGLRIFSNISRMSIKLEPGYRYAPPIPTQVD